MEQFGTASRAHVFGRLAQPSSPVFNSLLPDGESSLLGDHRAIKTGADQPKGGMR